MMDAEKLIEEGARVIVKLSGGDPNFEAFWTKLDGVQFKYHLIWRMWKDEAHAIITMMLKAIISEEANITTGDILLACGEMTAQELRTVKAVLNWRLSNLRAIAEQVEKANG